MQPKEMGTGMEVLKVTQDKYDFPSNKCCSPCESSTRFVNMQVQYKEERNENVVKENILSLFANQNLRNYMLICY